MTPLNTNSGTVTILGNSAPAPTPAAVPAETVTPTTGAHDEDAAVAELQAGRDKQLQKIKAIETVTKPLTGPFNAIAEIQQLGHTQIDLTTLMDIKVLAILQKNLKESPISKLSVEQVTTLIQEKVEGSQLEGIFKKFPVLLEISVNILRDKDALAGLLGILMRKDDLKIYGYLCIGFFLFGMFVKFRMIKPNWTFFKKFRFNMSVNLVMTGITFYVFFRFFGEEIGPTISVISKSL